MGRFGALGTMAGVILSGPLAIIVVEAVAPQPPWSGPEPFVRSFSAIQSAPYLAGFLLVGSLVVLMVATQALAPAAHRARSTAALVLTAAFATLICFNYILQTTFVPHLVSAPSDRGLGLIEAFTMGNPTSLAWALEMWGYGLLGVATWLAAPAIAALGRRWAGRLFVANGIISVAGAGWTALDPGWEMTPIGLVMFAGWNVVLFAMAASALPAFRALRTSEGEPTAPSPEKHANRP